MQSDRGYLVHQEQGENVLSAIFNQVLLHWRDKNDKTAVQFIPTQDQDPGAAAGFASLATAMQACSDAALVAVQFQCTYVISAVPGDGPYCTVYDRAVMFDKNSVTNVTQRQAIVGPKASIFLPGNQKVDLTNSSILALQTQAMDFLGDQDGNPIGSFLRGKRQEAGPA